MLTVGLTGGIASGKSILAQGLSRLGAICVDSDEIAHQEMKVGTPVFNGIVDYFGTGILGEDGQISRKLLGADVFSNPERLRALNEIVHPAVIDHLSRLLNVWRADPPADIGVVQVPLLVEANMVHMFDVAVVVVSSPELQLRRLVEAGYDEDDAAVRLKSQISDAERLSCADLTVINKGNIDLFMEQIPVVFEKLKRVAGKNGG